MTHLWFVGLPGMKKADARAFGPGFQTNVAHQVRRQMAGHPARTALFPRGPKELARHRDFLSGNKAGRGAKLRGEVFVRSVDKAGASLADNQSGDGTHLKCPGALAVGLDGA